MASPPSPVRRRSLTPFVGIGDAKIAVTAGGRLTVLVMVAVSLVAIPVQTAALYGLLTMRRVVLGSAPQPAKEPTVLVATRLTDFGSFSDFFGEFVSGQGQHAIGSRPPRLVFLCNKPQFEFRAFQASPPRRAAACRSRGPPENKARGCFSS